MPWKVEKGHGCPPSKPWAVIKETTGEKVACHATHAKAAAQVRALYASENQKHALANLPFDLPFEAASEYFQKKLPLPRAGRKRARKMTRRERLERRAENLREWAGKREVKAAAVFEAGEPFTSDIAFNTQPGHIPFRARLIAREDRAHESLAKARDMKARAAGIEEATGRAIYSDDTDAIEQLEVRIREREAECARVVELNKAIRREVKAGLAEGWADRVGATESEKAAMLRNVRYGNYNGTASPVFPPYVTANMRNLIRADRQRIESIGARERQQQSAEEAGGMVIQRTTMDTCQVTFAEKPARSILDALKAAGFFWSGGSWIGSTAKLPEAVASMEES